MDPIIDLTAAYLDLCRRFGDRPEVAKELERLQAAVSATCGEAWRHFLAGRVAMVHGEYQTALEAFEAAVRADPDFFFALHMQGVCLGIFGRREEALATCNQAIGAFADTHNPAILGHLARVMVNRGATLGELGRHEESIDVCNEIVARFGDADDPVLQEQVAKAIINRGVSFGELGRHVDELAACEEVVARFAESESPPLVEQVVWAMVHRGIALGELGQREEEIAAYEEVIARYGDADDPTLREAVAEARFNKKVAIGGPDVQDDTPRLRIATEPPDDSDDSQETLRLNHEDEGTPIAMPEEPVSMPEAVIERIHAAPEKLVVVMSGGGSLAVAELLQVPGASRTLLEAVVPYGERALDAWIGGRPEEYCSAATARTLAMVAFRRAWKYEREQPTAIGMACTASLASDRPKRGAHRIHVALQTARQTATWSLFLEKGRRSRAEEERLAGRLLINCLAESCGVAERLAPGLFEGERIERIETRAAESWQDLLLAKIETVCPCALPVRAILPGAFNPLHVGHRGMAEIGAAVLGEPVTYELSILNVDKPPLDYFEIDRRLGQFSDEQRVCLTRASTFVEKSRLFPGATFLVGVDTLRRIADPRYYRDDPKACAAALEIIAGRECRFLVFGRNVGTGFARLSDLDLPESLRAICTEIPAEEFRKDISSTNIRKSGKW